jgi:hypothetical protein
MTMLRRPLQTLIILTASVFTLEAHAAEICGNGIDDDADLLVDEQCYPGLATGQCESPLSCADTGDVSPSTGSLRYQLAPDIAPNVPFGPGIGFRRFYVSQYAPGGGAPAYRKPLGERWGHTYMSWLDKNTSPNPDQVVVHLPRGQDAMFQFNSTVAGWDEYKTFQPGFHFQYLRQRTTSPNEYELKTLTGEVLVYNSSGKLIEIRDTLATPNKVLIAYDGNGQVSTVTDASGKRRLLFSYTSSKVSSIAFQINTGSWVTQHTTDLRIHEQQPHQRHDRWPTRADQRLHVELPNVDPGWWEQDAGQLRLRWSDGWQDRSRRHAAWRRRVRVRPIPHGMLGGYQDCALLPQSEHELLHDRRRLRYWTPLRRQDRRRIHRAVLSWCPMSDDLESERRRDHRRELVRWEHRDLRRCVPRRDRSRVEHHERRARPHRSQRPVQ